MPASQTSYARAHDAGRPGQIADLATCDADTHIVGKSAGIAFGVACQIHNDGTSDVPGEAQAGIAANKYLGVSVLDPTRDPTEEDSYAQGAHASVAWRGDIYVNVEYAVEYGEDAVARSDTGALSSARVTAAWAASNAYKVGDVVTISGSSYPCQLAHTSAAGNVAAGAPGQSNATGWDAALTTTYTHIAVPGAAFRKKADAGDLTIIRLTGRMLAA